MSLFTSPKYGFRRVMLLAALPLLFVVFAFIPPKDEDGLKLGSLLPLAERAMSGVDGSSTPLKDFSAENGLIVVFSCNTCPFVVGSESFPGWERQYNALHAMAEAKQIGFVLVNANEGKRDGDDSMDAMISHAQEAAYTMPYVIDQNHELADAVGAKTTPHVFVFDKELRLVYKGSIDNSWDSKRNSDEAYLEQVITYLSGGPKLREQSTPPRGCSIKRVIP